MSKGRIVVAVLTLSAVGLIGITTQESYTDNAVIPTKGDRPTYGFGSTKKIDGTPVRLGDRIDPVRALHTVQAHVAKDENRFRDSLPGVKLTQGEYDLYMDFVYQYGITAWMGSSMRRELLRGRYVAACEALLQWKRAGGYDCSTLVGGKPNKRCWGVWTRQKERNGKCLTEQL